MYYSYVLIPSFNNFILLLITHDLLKYIERRWTLIKFYWPSAFTFILQLTNPFFKILFTV